MGRTMGRWGTPDTKGTWGTSGAWGAWGLGWLFSGCPARWSLSLPSWLPSCCASSLFLCLVLLYWFLMNTAALWPIKWIAATGLPETTYLTKKQKKWVKEYGNKGNRYVCTWWRLTRGIIDASATLRPFIPCTLNSGSTTAIGSEAGPILQDPAWWFSGLVS